MRSCLAVLFLMTSVITSCSLFRSRVTCDQFIDPRLSAIPFSRLAPADIVGWISETFKLRTGQITVSGASQPNYDSTTQLNVLWTDGNIEYQAIWANSKKFIWARLTAQPTVEEVIACIGPPAYYLASKHLYADGYEVSLWYTQRGLIFEHTVLTRGFRFPAPSLEANGNTVIESIMYVESGDIDSLIYNTYGRGVDTDFRNKLIKALRPWPGKAADMVVD